MATRLYCSAEQVEHFGTLGTLKKFTLLVISPGIGLHLLRYLQVLVNPRLDLFEKKTASVIRPWLRFCFISQQEFKRFI